MPDGRRVAGEPSAAGRRAVAVKFLQGSRLFTLSEEARSFPAGLQSISERGGTDP
jgi:hypothetical protein